MFGEQTFAQLRTGFTSAETVRQTIIRTGMGVQDVHLFFQSHSSSAFRGQDRKAKIIIYLERERENLASSVCLTRYLRAARAAMLVVCAAQAAWDMAEGWDTGRRKAMGRKHQGSGSSGVRVRVPLFIIIPRPPALPLLIVIRMKRFC